MAVEQEWVVGWASPLSARYRNEPWLRSNVNRQEHELQLDLQVAIELPQLLEGICNHCQQLFRGDSSKQLTLLHISQPFHIISLILKQDHAVLVAGPSACFLMGMADQDTAHGLGPLEVVLEEARSAVSANSVSES